MTDDRKALRSLRGGAMQRDEQKGANGTSFCCGVA